MTNVINTTNIVTPQEKPSFPPTSIVVPDEKLFLGASDISDFHTAKFFASIDSPNCRVLSRELVVSTPSRSDWIDFVENKLKLDKLVEYSVRSGKLFTQGCMATYHISKTSVSVYLIGLEDSVNALYNTILSNFGLVGPSIQWIYNNEGDSIRIPLNNDRTPVEEMYPFLEGKTLQEYYNEFIHSNSNILLLIGQPGTGKTSFIRGLLSMCNQSAIVAYDSNILEKDRVFVQFVDNDECNIMVMEDSDNFLSSRKSGNTVMHKLLNLGDGLITAKGKKLIFSTNLPSIEDVDQALLREGRCFGVLKFTDLTQDQFDKLADRLNVPRKSGVKTLAQFFNESIDKSMPDRPKIGF